MERNLYDDVNLGLSREIEPSRKSAVTFGEPVDFAFTPCVSTDWAQLRSQQLFCDGFVISEDGVQVAVHKALLATCSSFFRAAYTPPLGSDSIQLQCSSEILHQILDYIYTGSRWFSEAAAKEILIVADMYCMEDLSQHCSHILETYLSPENSVGIYQLAKGVSCAYLEAASRYFILSHFESVMLLSEELYSLEKAELAEFLESDLLNISKEELVVEVIDKWVERNPENRMAAKSELILNMRDVPCWFPWMHRMFMTHWPRCPHQIIVTVGGYADEVVIKGSMETYDPRAQMWLPWGTQTNDARAYHGLAVLGGYVYIIGGFDGLQFLASVMRFDPIPRCWTEVSHMTTPRCFVSVVTLEGFIYAFGGRSGRQSRLRSCERYDAALNQWQNLPPMNCNRSDAGAAALNGKIYVAGGYDGSDVMESVEVFDPNTSRWSFYVNLPSPRSGLQLVAHEGRIYALGGYDGEVRLSCVDSISDNSLFWRQEQSMMSSRSNFAAVSFENRIWAIGGYGQDTGTLDATESFVDNEWYVEPPLITDRSCLAGVVLKDIPDPYLYSYKFWDSNSRELSEMEFATVEDYEEYVED